MPFKSEAQRKWMHANKPSMAKKWEKHTPDGKKLPSKVAFNDDMDDMEFAMRLHDAWVNKRKKKKADIIKQSQLDFVNQELQAAQARQQEREEERQQDMHEQQLRFNEDEHELKLQQLALQLAQSQEAFSLKQQQTMQRDEEAAAAKREGAVQQQQVAAEQAQQQAVAQQDQWRQNLMAKGAAYYDETGQPVDLGKGIPSALLGAGMGGAAAHYMFPREGAKRYREMAKAITPAEAEASIRAAKKRHGKLPLKNLKTVSDVTLGGNKVRFKAPAHVRKTYFSNRALQSNAGRLLKGTGLGLLAGLAARAAMEA